MKLRPGVRPSERPADELKRLRGLLADSRNKLASKDAKVEAITERQAQFDEQVVTALVDGCDPVDERERQQLEVEKTDALREQRDLRRVVDALAERIAKTEHEIEKAERQAIEDEILVLRARSDQQRAALFVTETAITNAEVRLEDLSLPEPTRQDVEWHVRRALEGLPTAPPTNGKLARRVAEALATYKRDPHAEREATHVAARSVRLPSGGPAYMQWPSGPDPHAIPLNPER